MSNTGTNYIGEYNTKHGSGALTVFENSHVKVDRCTFTGNWNGADDKGTGNVYTNSIFWMNTKSGGISPGGRYELDILDGEVPEDPTLRLTAKTEDWVAIENGDLNPMMAMMQGKVKMKGSVPFATKFMGLFGYGG